MMQGHRARALLTCCSSGASSACNAAAPSAAAAILLTCRVLRGRRRQSIGFFCSHTRIVKRTPRRGELSGKGKFATAAKRVNEAPGRVDIIA
jgi:hypothetical protein